MDSRPIIEGLLATVGFVGAPMLVAAQVAMRLSRREVATRTWIKYATVLISAVVTTALAMFLIALCADGREALTVHHWTDGAAKMDPGALIGICLIYSCIAMVPAIGILVRSKKQENRSKGIENNRKKSGE